MVDVARAAGVSQPTASRVFSGDPRVAPASREAVLAAARAMGYVVNRAASSLAANRANSIGLVIAEPGSHLWGNPYFPRLLAGITSALTSHRQQLVLFMPQSRDEERQLVDYLNAGHVDAVLMTTSRNRDPLLRDLLASGLPVVTAGRPIGVPTARYVDIDNEQAAYDAVAHLVERGYRRIATVAGPGSTAAGRDRLKGYRRAIEHCGGSGAEQREVVVSDFGQLSGETATREILQRWPDTDAIFAAADLLAIGSLTALRLLDVPVPQQVGLVGFDDSDIVRATEPPITSVAQPVEALGAAMVEMLLGSSSSVHDLILPTHLEVRASSSQR